MNGSEFLEKLDLPNAFVEAATESFKDGIGELTKEEIVRQGGSAIWSLLAEEGAKTIVGTISGPLLRVLLRLADQSKGKLDKVIREPFISGTSKARRMLKMKIITPADRELRDAELKTALDDLNKAYSYTDQKEQIQRLRIRLLQVTIAIFMHAPGYARAYGEELAPILNESLSGIDRELDTKRSGLRDLMFRKHATIDELMELRRVRLAELKDPSTLLEFFGPWPVGAHPEQVRLHQEGVLSSLRKSIVEQTTKSTDEAIARARSEVEESVLRLNKLKAIRSFLGY